MKTRTTFAVLTLVMVTSSLRAQDHSTMDHATHAKSAAQLPALPGQDAFGAISEIVKLLAADPTTNWSTVDIERLRRHLADMSHVMLESQVTQTSIPGGVRMLVTAKGSTIDAIRRMTTSHSSQLAPLGLTAASKPAAGGAELTVVATNARDSLLVAKLRGLGFGGIMTLGNHHAPHHLAMAKGQAIAGHDRRDDVFRCDGDGHPLVRGAARPGAVASRDWHVAGLGCDGAVRRLDDRQCRLA